MLVERACVHGLHDMLWVNQYMLVERVCVHGLHDMLWVLLNPVEYVDAFNLLNTDFFCYNNYIYIYIYIYVYSYNLFWIRFSNYLYN